MFASLSRDFHKSLTLLKSSDFYKILGIKKNTPDSEIKSAYFALAKKFHPDVNKSKDAKEKFSEINTAYETLGDKTKRKIYDSTGLNADEQKQEEDAFENFEDYFEVEMPEKKKGDDVTVSIEISFLEAINGCSKSVSYDKKSICGSCKGTRAKAGTSPIKCSYCYGYGSVFIQQGPISIQTMCTKCKGTGFIIKSYCPPCKGSGFSSLRSSETINIPGGVDNNFTIKFAQKGHVSTSKGHSGDLFVKLRVKDHPLLKRKGFDILTTTKLHIGQAVLGGIAEIQTLHGKIEIKVEPGLNNCENLRLSNYGIQHLPPNSGQRGNHIVSFSVHIPKTLTLKQKEILEKLAKLENN